MCLGHGPADGSTQPSGQRFDERLADCDCASKATPTACICVLFCEESQHTERTTVEGSLSPARALRTQPCQRAAKGLSSIAWTRHHTLARGLKATNRLLLPAPATKQEPPTEGTAPELVTRRRRGTCFLTTWTSCSTAALPASSSTAALPASSSTAAHPASARRLVRRLVHRGPGSAESPLAGAWTWCCVRPRWRGGSAHRWAAASDGEQQQGAAPSLAHEGAVRRFKNAEWRFNGHPGSSANRLKWGGP